MANILYGGTKEEMQRLLDDASKIAGVEFNIDSYADVVEAIHVMQESMGIAGTTAEEAASTIEGSINMCKSAWENWLVALATDDVDFTQKTEELLDAISAVAQNVVPRLAEVVQTIIAELPNFATQVAEALPPLAEQIGGSLVGSLVEGVVNAFKGIADFVTGLLSAIDWQAWGDMLADIASHFGFLNQQTEDGVTPAQQIGEAFGKFMDSIRDSTAVQAFAQALKDIGDSIKQANESGDWGWLQAIGDVLGFVNEGLGQLYGHLKEIDGAIQEWNGGEAMELLDPSTWHGFENTANAIGEAFSGAGEAIGGFFSTVGEGIAGVGDFFTQLPENFDSLLNSIGEFVQPAVDGLNGFFDGIVQGAISLGEMFSEIGSQVGAFFGNIASTVGSAVSAIGGWFASLPATASSMAAGISAAFQALAGFLASIPSRIGSFFASMPSTLSNLFNSAANGIRNIFNGVVSFVASIPSRIIGYFSGIGQRITSAIGSIHFPTPHVSWSSIDVLGQSVSLPHIDWYAKGGFVDGATLIGAGEAGAEMILPQRGRLMEQFAAAVASQSASGINATFVVNNADDPERFARQTMRAMGRLARAEA